MDVKAKAAWLSALRGGAYRQGTGQLYDERTDTFCCLGVLLDCTGADYDDNEPELNDSQMRRYDLTYEQQSALVDMNDVECLPFTTIADYIEENL